MKYQAKIRYILQILSKIFTIRHKYLFDNADTYQQHKNKENKSLQQNYCSPAGHVHIIGSNQAQNGTDFTQDKRGYSHHPESSGKKPCSSRWYHQEILWKLQW